jgi:hypothetical protein
MRKGENMLTDKDPCPVQGQHFGKPMEKVPASFLDWMIDQPWASRKYPEVIEYIEKNRTAIDAELQEQGLI